MDAIPLRQLSIGYTFSVIRHQCSTVFVRDDGLAMGAFSEAHAVSVADVVLVVHPFKIGRHVVELAAVDVVDRIALLISGAESQRHKAMEQHIVCILSVDLL